MEQEISIRRAAEEVLKNSLSPENLPGSGANQP
jgi:hypothetical protein